MGRPKKDSKPINLNLDRMLVEYLERYCDELGQTKTTALERILKRFFLEYYGEELKDKHPSTEK